MRQLASSKRSTAEDVADAVLTEIRAGTYGPGDRLPTELELAKDLGVGRTSVREGIGKLRMLGVVEVRRGLGTFVVGTEGDPGPTFLQWAMEHRYQIASLFEVRMSLEGTAASLAAQRANMHQIQALQRAAQAHQQAHADGDLARLVTTDQEFHQCLLAASNNDALYDVYGSLVPRLIDYRRKSLALEGAPARSSHDHLAIVDAIQRRDPRRARQEALKHLETLYREVLQAASDGSSAPDAVEMPWL